MAASTAFALPPSFAYKRRSDSGRGEDAAQAEAVDHSARHAARAGGRRHALLADLAERNLERRLRRLGGRVASSGLDGDSMVTPTRGGWPLAATLTVPGDVACRAATPTFRRPGLEGRPVGAAHRAVTAGAAGDRGRGQAAASPGRDPEVPYTADRLRLVLPLQRGCPGHTSPTSSRHNLRADTPAGGDARQPDDRSLRLHLDFRPAAQSGEPALEFSLQAEAIGLPPGIGRPLGPRIANLEMEGALNGPVPAGRTLAERATAWRDGGGSLEIQPSGADLGAARSHCQRHTGARRPVAADGRRQCARGRLCRDTRHTGGAWRDQPVRCDRGEGRAVAAGAQRRRTAARPTSRCR